MIVIAALISSNLRSWNQSKGFASTGAGSNARSLDARKSLVKGEFAAVASTLTKLIDGHTLSCLKLLEISTRSITQLIQLSLDLKSMKLKLCGRNLSRTLLSRGVLLLSSMRVLHALRPSHESSSTERSAPSRTTILDVLHAFPLDVATLGRSQLSNSLRALIQSAEL